MENVQTVPRWLRGGLISIGAALVLAIAPWLIRDSITGEFAPLVLGPIAPAIPFTLLPDSYWWVGGLLIVPWLPGFWFLIGALLVKFTRGKVWAVFIWLIVYIACGVLMYIWVQSVAPTG
jgi:hypothetical protein